MEILLDVRINENFEYEDIINQAIKQTLTLEGIACPLEISVSIVSLEEIQALNKQYRSKDSVTDVLSFPLLDEDELQQGLKQNKLLPVGDIVICLEQAKFQANEYAHPIERELAFLAVHSTLHLLGYDHLDLEDEEIMFDKQKRVLKEMNLRY